MVLIKMSSNAVLTSYNKLEEKDKPKQRVIRPQVLPPTTFDNPILLDSSSSSSEDELEVRGRSPPLVSLTNLIHPTTIVSTNSRSSNGGLTPKPERLQEFSNSDVCVSGTSDSTSSSEDESVSCQPLSDLRNLITRKSRKVNHDMESTNLDDDVPFINLTDFSQSDDSSSDSSSDPLFKPPYFLVSSLKCDSSQSLIVQIPLHLVSVRNHAPTTSSIHNQLPVQKLKRSFPLSHFATTKKRAINDNDTFTSTKPSFLMSSGIAKPPISLKLMKSPTGSSWQSATPIDPPSPNKHVTCSNRTLLTTKSKTVCTENSKIQAFVPLVTTAKTDSEHASSKQTEDDVTSLGSNSSLTTSSSLATTVTSTTNGHPPSSKSNKLPSKGRTNNKPKRCYTSRTSKPITNVKNVKSTICFEKHFGHLSSQLVLHKGELQPLHSLSLKNVNSIPPDHPIHGWTLGRPVPKSRTTRKPSPHPLGSY